MEDKRNRSANLTEEEKIKLLALLQKYNDILCKKTDFVFNKKKDIAWMKLEQNFNSNNQFKRNVTSLKKIWNKLKYEAKTFKSKIKISVMGTGGGPSTHKENNILEEVLFLIGRAGVGIANIPDCDFEPDSNIVIEMDQNMTEIFAPIEVENKENEAKEKLPIPQVFEETGETAEFVVKQIPPVSVESRTDIMPTPSSRRRPIYVKTPKDQLIHQKIESKKLKQNALKQEINHGIEKRQEERELLEIEKRKGEQIVKIRNIILQKLESKEDVDPALIESIFKNWKYFYFELFLYKYFL
ncbi:unnamed protein product [Psylliodes chrysocephalus]|uniref:Regulatory protein zeste n=1 Tax=Psylliodes chrysocephalus TaxID=3402493 RepID=A0A9P0DBM3_9CUCU|nr:unnamed protein product [Psylliodes chrysocephala]